MAGGIPIHSQPITSSSPQKGTHSQPITSSSPQKGTHSQLLLGLGGSPLFPFGSWRLPLRPFFPHAPRPPRASLAPRPAKRSPRAAQAAAVELRLRGHGQGAGAFGNAPAGFWGAGLGKKRGGRDRIQGCWETFESFLLVVV